MAQRLPVSRRTLMPHKQQLRLLAVGLQERAFEASRRIKHRGWKQAHVTKREVWRAERGWVVQRSVEGKKLRQRGTGFRAASSHAACH